ncbi:MAG: hypothetical protein JJU42_04570 [Rhodobacteraceae bacterium]|nr:hypothetical protein [Paracoccaceae bacterium]
MIRARHLALACLINLLLAPIAQAGTDWGDFETEMGVLPPDEAAEMRERIAAEIAAERARDEAARQAALLEAERIAAERAARPLGEQLVEARCLSCHDVEQIDSTTLGAPGWTITVIRMEWLNGARLEPGERAVIVSYLSARNPDRTVKEWAFVVTAGAAVVALGLGAWAWRRKRWLSRHAR